MGRTYVPPIDYDKVRIAIIRAIGSATQLSQNHVIMAEGEAPNQPRPTKPYFTVKFLTAALHFGNDDVSPTSSPAGQVGTFFNYGGPRSMTLTFNAFGRSHEEAYGYMAGWQAALEQEPTRDALSVAGISVWTIGAVADLSILMNTGYEGRALMDCTFGLAANSKVDLGQISQVQVIGTVASDSVAVTQVISNVILKGS